MIATEDVRRIAQLAKLQLTDAQVEEFQHELNDVVEAMGKLQQVPTENIEPYDSQPVSAETMRPDIPRPSVPAPLLDAVPDRAGDYIRVKEQSDRV